jgi:hypothetical protein
MTTRIFISSVQKELAAERRALKEYIEGDPPSSRGHGRRGSSRWRRGRP